MNKLIDKKGSVSLVTIMIMSVLLPFLIFIFVDMTNIMFVKNKLQHVTDNACASAIVVLKEKDLGNGVLSVDENKANKIVEDILKTQLNLDDNLKPINNKSFLYDSPKITLKVFNKVPKNGYIVKTSKGDINIKNTSVLLNVDYPIHLAFFKNIKINLSKISVNQVEF